MHFYSSMCMYKWEPRGHPASLQYVSIAAGDSITDVQWLTSAGSGPGCLMQYQTKLLYRSL